VGVGLPTTGPGEFVGAGVGVEAAAGVGVGLEAGEFVGAGAAVGAGVEVAAGVDVGSGFDVGVGVGVPSTSFLISVPDWPPGTYSPLCLAQLAISNPNNRASSVLLDI
jgi:hypothetical protein